MKRNLRDGLALLILLSTLTGVAYPLLVTGLAQAIFPGRANGSMIRERGLIVGSELIGQGFRHPAYLWSRPSATATHPYNAAHSSGSNLGPLSPDLARAVKERIGELRAAPGADSSGPVPIDLVTASGSGLDPHISPAAAFHQIGRIAAARRLALAQVREVVAHHVEPRQFGVLGEPRVNVLRVNLDLDKRFGAPIPVAGTPVSG